MNIKDSVVFVTGGNRGIGLACAREALARGAAKVYVGTRHPERFEEPGLIPVKIDVTDLESIRAAAKAAPDVTLLINNAGVAELSQDPFVDDIEAQSRRIFETNYYGVIRTTNAFMSAIPTDGRGAIINVISDATWRVHTVLTAYAASKAAAWAYTNSIRASLKDKRIQVLGLHVGFVDTDLTKGIDVPKTDPKDVARLTFDALEAGKSEILADEGTRELKKSLSDETPCYLV